MRTEDDSGNHYEFLDRFVAGGVATEISLNSLSFASSVWISASSRRWRDRIKTMYKKIVDKDNAVGSEQIGKMSPLRTTCGCID